MNDILELGVFPSSPHIQRWKIYQGKSITPERLNFKPYEDITLVTEDGVKIKCYLIQKKDSESYVSESRRLYSKIYQFALCTFYLLG